MNIYAHERPFRDKTKRSNLETPSFPYIEIGWAVDPEFSVDSTFDEILMKPGALSAMETMEGKFDW